MNNVNYIGVFREAEHSPERVLDDELILRAVGDRLALSPYNNVTLIYPSELSAIDPLPDLIFYMAEEDQVLHQLEEFNKKGVLLVNSIQGVKNTFRKNMTRMLSTLPFVPETLLTECSSSSINGITYPVWIKRGDYHAIEQEDVVFAGGPDSLKKIMASFKSRGIETVAIQQHIEGDLIKFYGVRDMEQGVHGQTRWFHWFYHRDQELGNYRFHEAELQGRCEQAADRLGLEIFGGDAIVTSQGEIFVIDVNAWPSFALFRDTASRHIAEHISSRVQRRFNLRMEAAAA